MSRTLTAAPTDRSMWRRLLALIHPDRGGTHDLFVWAAALREHVSSAGDGFEDARSAAQRRQPPHPTSSTGERIDCGEASRKAESFAALTRQAVELADEVEPVHGRLLRLLADCYEASQVDVTAMRAQHQGATYKQLAYIAHLAEMSGAQRAHWYRIAEQIPLAQRHAGHIIAALQSERD